LASLDECASAALLTAHYRWHEEPDVSLFYRFYLFSCSTDDLNYIFVGDTVKAYFSLFSAQAGGVDDWDCDDYATFSYFFVACRNPYNSNKDFGSSGEVSLSLVSHSAAVGGGASVFAKSPTLDATGTWSFWPSYNWGGQFGEQGWNEIDITAIEPTPPPACVLKGTQILLPDGTSKPIEDLKKGDSIAGYDIGSGKFVSEIVIGNMRSYVNSVIDINHGLLVVTPTSQPIYVRHDSFAGWVTDPRDLQVGWEIFSPTSGTWVLITSLDLLQGQFVVYDLGASSPDNYVANGLLLDRKPHK
ncbi:MAG: Hint domain-containing protein, partial [Thermoplasmata archaeon]